MMKKQRSNNVVVKAVSKEDTAVPSWLQSLYERTGIISAN